MKTIKFLTMAALALMTAACSKDDNELANEQPTQARGIPFTATISIDDGATTRALEEKTTGLEATWEEGEKVALIYSVGSDPLKTEAEVTHVEGGVATISARLVDGTADNTPVTIIYPSSAAMLGTEGFVHPDLLNGVPGPPQLGTFEDVKTRYDLRKGTGYLSVGGTATLKKNVTLENQFCIFKFTIKDIDGSNDLPTNMLEVYDENDKQVARVISSTALSEMYVALPTTPTTLKFYAMAYSGGGYHYNKATGLTLGKNYYKSTLKLASPGDVILMNGKFAKATATGTKVAMIVGVKGFETAGNYKSLAIALSDANGGNPCAWSNENEAAGVSTSAAFDDHSGFYSGITDTQTLITKYGSDYAAAKASSYSVEGFNPTANGFSNWFLPSSGQWLSALYYMGAKKLTAWDSFSSGGAADVTTLNTLLTAAGGALKANETYWTSSAFDDEYAVAVNFDSSNGIKMFASGKTFENIVRPFIAF